MTGEFNLPFILLLVFPMIISGIGHMLIVKFDFFSSLKVPVNQKLFGANKTWRGIVVMPVLTILSMWILFSLHELRVIDAGPLLNVHPVVSGFLLGLAYVLGELPNSFIKRRLGVAPGMLPQRNRFFFFILDHSDSALGCIVVYRLLFGFSWFSLLWMLILGIVIHTVINLILYAAKIRKNPF
ncbi:MAG TPA: CDP-archaeol synthase [Bacteriovoracaceae bacterium]|nr:CDP-archaeol synthase [Bacteriovoracaceae bacterium]